MGLLDRPYGETHTLGVSRGPVAGFAFSVPLRITSVILAGYEYKKMDN